ncbi:MAG TPA: hypothetical protein DCP91_06810 [Eggerthellaceae bacterium]|nr:hypothetical protein [Eggerthellaceae bacterium]
MVLMVAASQFCVAYVVVDFLCLVLTVIISSNISRDSGSELQVRYFLLLLTANLVFVVFDAIWAILVFSQAFNPSDVLLCIVNGVNLTAIAFAAYFWLGFSLAYFRSKVTNSKLLRILTAIPAALVVVFHAIGYFTNQNVIFMPDGSIAYGAMHIVITFVPLLYLLAATTLAIRQYRIATTREERQMSLMFIVFMLAPASAAVFDLFVPDMPVAAAGIMISVVFVMMGLQESRISNDALTGLNNRRRAESYLESSMSRASASHPLCLFIIDMDHFKDINDTYGHLEGDHALRLMADALRSVCSQVNAFAGRWGGDEFVVISAEGASLDPETVARLIQETLTSIARESRIQYDLACSVGYAVCKSASETRAHLVAGADDMLYRNKLAR